MISRMRRILLSDRWRVVKGRGCGFCGIVWDLEVVVASQRELMASEREGMWRVRERGCGERERERM